MGRCRLAEMADVTDVVGGDGEMVRHTSVHRRRMLLYLVDEGIWTRISWLLDWLSSGHELFLYTGYWLYGWSIRPVKCCGWPLYS